MVFEYRVNLPNKEPPGRVYISSLGLKEVYESYENAIKYVVSFLEARKDVMIDFDYFLASVWADTRRRDKVIDFFGYNKIENWPGNPEVKSWIVRNGHYLPHLGTTCEDTLILLGREGEYRKTTSDLKSYIEIPPIDLGGLENYIKKTLVL